MLEDRFCFDPPVFAAPEAVVIEESSALTESDF
jgi:hypothetical protein